MVLLTGSATADRNFLRQLHFFEPMALSLVATSASLFVPGWPVSSLARPLGIAAVLLAWSWMRLRPLAAFVTPARPALLARRPGLSMLLGAGVILPLVVVAAVIRWDGWRAEGLALVLLVAAFGGLPLGAAFWEDRFGRKARQARRRTQRPSRSAA